MKIWKIQTESVDDNTIVIRLFTSTYSAHELILTKKELTELITSLNQFLE